MPVHAQVLVGTNDEFGVAFGKTLQVEALGVLENDLLDGEPAGENGATAELLEGVNSGELSCPGSPGLALCADGSFEYIPGAQFNGIDAFSYRVVLGGVSSAIVTVRLIACTGGPTIYACWKEAAYLSKLAEHGYGVFSEGFEGAAWDVARTSVSDPNSVTSVTSQGITWTSNHPDTNNITTSSGAARSGNWGGYDAQHGLASGTAGSCDLDDPPPNCLYHDGLSGNIQSAGAVLHGVGSYSHGIYGAKLELILDDTVIVGLGLAGFYEEQFHGAIDLGESGFSSFEFRETDGKIGQALYVWFDDFKLATAAAPVNIPPVANAGPDQAASVGDTVMLDGSSSFDANEDSLGYNWVITEKPAGSTALISDPAAVTPSFTADLAGSYVAKLVVSDAQTDSLPDTLEVVATSAVTNVLPVADAGMDQVVPTGQLVILDGSGSYDDNGDPMSYHWILSSVPMGSLAGLSSPSAITPGFMADLPGRYIAELTVSDAVGDSAPDTVEIEVTDTSDCHFNVIRSTSGRVVVICL